MSERKGDLDILDRATDALRNEPVPPLPAALLARTQFAVRGHAAAEPARRSPLRHPLLRIAAAVTLVTCGVAAYLALRPPAQPVDVAQERGSFEVQPEIRPGNKPDAPRAVAQGPGTVGGRARFNGPRPPVREMSMAANAHCAAHHNGRVLDESVVVNDDGSLRNVVVWVSGGLEGKRFEPPIEPAVLDQQGCVFRPHVVPVMVGQRLLVKNSDEFLHNVRAAAANNPPFNFAQPTIDRGTPLVFGAPERMFVKCDIHPWMSAFVQVMDNPFFAVTGDGGAFRLPELPPGEYEVSAWHEVYGQQRQSVRVEPGKQLDLQFTFQPVRGVAADAPGAGGHRAVEPAACCRTTQVAALAPGM